MGPSVSAIRLGIYAYLRLRGTPVRFCNYETRTCQNLLRVSITATLAGVKAGGGVGDFQAAPEDRKSSEKLAGQTWSEPVT
jgi:hypothetical protein